MPRVSMARQRAMITAGYHRGDIDRNQVMDICEAVGWPDFSIARLLRYLDGAETVDKFFYQY